MLWNCNSKIWSYILWIVLGGVLTNFQGYIILRCPNREVFNCKLWNQLLQIFQATLLSRSYLFFKKILTKTVDLRDWKTLFLMGSPKDVLPFSLFDMHTKADPSSTGCGVFISLRWRKMWNIHHENVRMPLSDWAMLVSVVLTVKEFLP